MDLATLNVTHVLVRVQVAVLLVSLMLAKLTSMNVNVRKTGPEIIAIPGQVVVLMLAVPAHEDLSLSSAMYAPRTRSSMSSAYALVTPTIPVSTVMNTLVSVICVVMAATAQEQTIVMSACSTLRKLTALAYVALTGLGQIVVCMLQVVM